MRCFDHYDTFTFSMFRMSVNMTFDTFFLEKQENKRHPKPHYHKTWELYFVQKGEIEVDCNGTRKVYGASEFTFIPQYTEHCILYASEDVEYCSIRFSYIVQEKDAVSEAMEKMLRESAFVAIRSNEDIQSTLARLKGLYQSYVDSPQTRGWIYQKITASCLYLMTSLLEVRMPEETLLHYNFNIGNDSLAMIIEFFMMYDFQSQLTLPQLAESLNYSVSQTNRILRQNYGKTFKELAKEVRMNKAKYFLEKTDFPVKKISDILRFHDTRTFDRFFKSVEGITPTEYRRRMQG